MTKGLQQILKKLDDIFAAQGGGGGGVTEGQAQAIADAKVSDAAYDEAAWNADTTHAGSKNAVRDKIESVVASIPAAPSGGVIGTAIFTSEGSIGSLFTNGIIASVGYNSAGNYPVTFASNQPDTNYIIKVIPVFESSGFIATYSSKGVGGFSANVYFFDLENSPILSDPVSVQIEVTRLSQ